MSKRATRLAQIAADANPPARKSKRPQAQSPGAKTPRTDIPARRFEGLGADQKVAPPVKLMYWVWSYLPFSTG
jgi:hypothetical protein